MLDAALRSGEASQPAVFEVFTRRLPDRRQWGVFAGLGRFLQALQGFCFTAEQLEWLGAQRIVGAQTLAWLEDFNFTGDIYAYREGEIYTGGSPVLTVEGTFGQALLLETLALSILNFDSAVAVAASLITQAAGDRPVIEMGSRRTDPSAAVAAARAAYVGGFASTSNLEAGREFGLPTAGTASHAFTLAYPSEEQAFQAQVRAMGPGTTLLVDTFDIDEGIRTAVAVAGPRLGAVRVDSGDLGTEAVRARRLLDSLGATGTRLVVTGDLDAHVIAALGGAPVDAYGVGSNVVTGMGAPSAGFVYKLVQIGSDHRSVAKRSAGKSSFGGRKWAWRGRLEEPPARAGAGSPVVAQHVLADVVTSTPQRPQGGFEPLQVKVVEKGEPVQGPSLEEVRQYHLGRRASIGPAGCLVLDRRFS